MLTDPNTDVTPRPWWDRALDSVVDVLEDRVIDPVDEFVTPRVERHQARAAHRRVSEARRYAETRAVACWSWDHATHARLLHAWAGLESSAAHTRRGLHAAAHAGRVDDSNGCCASLIQLYRDRAEMIRALAVVDERIASIPGRSPNLGDMPPRLRRLAEHQFAELVRTYSTRERALIAESLVTRLKPELGAAVEPLRRLHIG